jgi:hypothetical protein
MTLPVPDRLVTSGLTSTFLKQQFAAGSEMGSLISVASVVSARNDSTNSKLLGYIATATAQLSVKKGGAAGQSRGPYSLYL